MPARRAATALTETSLLTIDEAAHLLKISRRSLYRLMARGRLRWRDIHGHRLIHQDDLTEYVESVRV